MSKLLEERENGTYFVGGDLDAARAYLRDTYGACLREGYREDGSYLVGEYVDDSDVPGQWGCSESGSWEEAWRYFIGTDFGPVDEFYDEDHLRTLLSSYANI